MTEGTPQEQNVQFTLPPELANGVYANFVLVHHATEHEITLDFCQIGMEPPTSEGVQARIVSRIHIAPTFVTPMLQAISTNAFRQEDMLRQLEEGEGGEPNEP